MKFQSDGVDHSLFFPLHNASIRMKILSCSECLGRKHYVQQTGHPRCELLRYVVIKSKGLRDNYVYLPPERGRILISCELDKLSGPF